MRMNAKTNVRCIRKSLGNKLLVLHHKFRLFYVSFY